MNAEILFDRNGKSYRHQVCVADSKEILFC